MKQTIMKFPLQANLMNAKGGVAGPHPAAKSANSAGTSKKIKLNFPH